MKNAIRTIIKIATLLLVSLFLSCSSDDDNDKQSNGSLEEIQGSWIRVGGNNPLYNGMVVNVQGNNGIISIPGNFPYPAGKIKWRNIGIKDGNLSLDDLLDTGNYTNEGIMKFGVDDTLRISHPGSTPGSEQKWVR